MNEKERGIVLTFSTILYCTLNIRHAGMFGFAQSLFLLTVDFQ